jgi:hypothetical protein
MLQVETVPQSPHWFEYCFLREICCLQMVLACVLYPQKLAVTSPTSGSRSVGIVRSRTKAN